MGDRAAFIEAVRQALYASKICSYAQGFVQLQAAAKEHDWPLNFGDCALLWRGGCIIRAQFLDRIKEAFDEDAKLENLLLHPYFREAIANGQAAWRHVVNVATTLGLPVPAFSTALAYYDSYRREFLPANLTVSPTRLLRGSYLQAGLIARGPSTPSGWIASHPKTELGG
ncbi:MAG: hypothetical protein R3B96_20285 [Pirellulaceae bacterium]